MATTRERSSKVYLPSDLAIVCSSLAHIPAVRVFVSWRLFACVLSWVEILYIPAVTSAFVEFLRDSFFHAGLVAVAAGTATASDANHAYHCFQESLQALVARGNSATVRRHTATDAAA